MKTQAVFELTGDDTPEEIREQLQRDVSADRAALSDHWPAQFDAQRR